MGTTFANVDKGKKVLILFHRIRTFIRKGSEPSTGKGSEPFTEPSKGQVERVNEKGTGDFEFPNSKMSDLGKSDSPDCRKLQEIRSNLSGISGILKVF